MAAQMTYSYATPSGIPGGILDIAPYEANSRQIESNDGVVKFGMGVVTGTSKGLTVKIPAAGTDVFEGVVLHKAHEQDAAGNVILKKGEAFSIMRFGRVWVRVVNGLTIADGDGLYLIASGDDAGCFTNVAGSNIAVSGRFVGANENGIAPIVLYNAPAPTAAAADDSGSDDGNG